MLKVLECGCIVWANDEDCTQWPNGNYELIPGRMSCLITGQRQREMAGALIITSPPKILMMWPLDGFHTTKTPGLTFNTDNPLQRWTDNPWQGSNRNQFKNSLKI